MGHQVNISLGEHRGLGSGLAAHEETQKGFLGVSSPMDSALVPESGLHRERRQQLKGGPRGDG